MHNKYYFDYSKGARAARIRFGCAPIEYKDLEPNIWTTQVYMTIPEEVKVWICNEYLCNRSNKNILQEP